MRTIGVVIPGVVHHTYLGEVYNGIADTAKQYRCTLLTNIQNPQRQDNLTHFLGRGGCDGVVVIVPRNFEKVLPVLRQSQHECVYIDYTRHEDIPDYPTVGVNNRDGIFAVMKHLLSLGHRRIAFIPGDLTRAGARERLDGYREGLQSADIAYDPALVVVGGWNQPLAYVASKEVLKQEPTAIVASNDTAAFAAYQAARERGLEIGRQISITGFDDIPLAASMTPPLTTVRQPMYQIGQTAVELLIKRLDGETLPELHVRLNTEFILRQSTGAV